MYLASKNGQYIVLYRLDDLIAYNKNGFIVYEPMFTNYGGLTIPRQSKVQKMIQNGELRPMGFQNDIPYWRGKPLPSIE